GRGDALAFHGNVAARDIRSWTHDLHLLVQRQIEELPGDVVDGDDQIRRHAVAGDDQEADVAAGLADLSRHVALARVDARPVRRDVDDPNREPRHDSFVLVGGYPRARGPEP